MYLGGLVIEAFGCRGTSMDISERECMEEGRRCHDGQKDIKKVERETCESLCNAVACCNALWS